MKTMSDDDFAESTWYMCIRESFIFLVVMASLTYVCFVPAKGLVRDLSAKFLQVCEWHITQLGMLM